MDCICTFPACLACGVDVLIEERTPGAIHCRNLQDLIIIVEAGGFGVEYDYAFIGEAMGKIFRSVPGCVGTRLCLPRMRGDDPSGASDVCASAVFAPHARG